MCGGKIASGTTLIVLKPELTVPLSLPVLSDSDAVPTQRCSCLHTPSRECVIDSRSGRGVVLFFGKHIYRLRTPLTANDPELVHRRVPSRPRGVVHSVEDLVGSSDSESSA